MISYFSSPLAQPKVTCARNFSAQNQKHKPPHHEQHAPLHIETNSGVCARSVQSNAHGRKYFPCTGASATITTNSFHAPGQSPLPTCSCEGNAQSSVSQLSCRRPQNKILAPMQEPLYQGFFVCQRNLSADLLRSCRKQAPMTKQILHWMVDDPLMAPI